MIKHFILILLLALTIQSNLFSKDGEQYYFKHITFDDFSSFVTDIHCSRKNGIIWIGTKDGLIRYDGQMKKLYKHEHDNIQTLPGNEIKKIIEDKEYNIWILTSNGVSLYSYMYDAFTIQKYNENPVISTCYCFISDGILFGGKGFVYKYSYKTKVFEEFCKLDEHYEVHNIIQLSDNEILCTNKWKGTYYYIKSNNKLVFRDKDKPLTIFKDSKSRIWVSLFNKGIKCYDIYGKLLKYYNTGNSSLSSNIILCVKEIENKIWLGTDGGRDKYH